MFVYKGEIAISEEKIYYNQKSIIDMIHVNTGCSTNDINKILKSLGNVVKDKFSDSDNYVELNIFPGLKVTSRYIPSEQTVSKNLNIKSKESMFLTATFSDDFRKKVRELHSKYICD